MRWHKGFWLWDAPPFCGIKFEGLHQIGHHTARESPSCQAFPRITGGISADFKRGGMKMPEERYRFTVRLSAEADHMMKKAMMIIRATLRSSLPRHIHHSPNHVEPLAGEAGTSCRIVYSGRTSNT